jgi:phosphoglycerate dehydrogenase-like enzyme
MSYREAPNQDNLILRYQSNNLIITPHIAWASQNQATTDGQLADNIRNFFQYKPFNQVTDALVNCINNHYRVNGNHGFLSIAIISEVIAPRA